MCLVLYIDKERRFQHDGKTERFLSVYKILKYVNSNFFRLNLKSNLICIYSSIFFAEFM